MSVDTDFPRWLVVFDPALNNWKVIGPGCYDGQVFETLGEADYYRSHRTENPGDYNQDGRTNSQDFFDFYWEWSQGLSKAEWDGAVGLNTSDVFSFIKDFMDG